MVLSSIALVEASFLSVAAASSLSSLNQFGALTAPPPEVVSDSALVWGRLTNDKSSWHKKQHDTNLPETSGTSKHIPSRVEQWWYAHIPSLMRYFVSGNMGNVCFYICERLVARAVDDHYHLLPALAQQLLDLPIRDSVSFVTAYMVHIPAQHYLHAVLVYGLQSIDTPKKYWQTLGGTYSALTTSCLGSTVLNHALIHAWGKQHKTLAFVATLWTFAVFNFFVLGWIVRQTSKNASSSSPPVSSADLSNTEPDSCDSTGVKDTPIAGLSEDAASPSVLLSNPLLASNTVELDRNNT